MMREICLLSLLMLLLVHVVVCSQTGREGHPELFSMCDTNNDSKISLKELKKCANFGEAKGGLVKKIFRVFDRDGDGFLSPGEYMDFIAKALDQEGDEDNDDYDEEVEVIDRDGNKKFMKKSEFDQLNQDKMKGLSMEDGEMSKLEEGQTSLEKVKEENPELARVIGIGKWIEEQLVSMGYASGKMVNMKTIDTKEEGKEEQRKLHENKDFQMKFELKMRKSIAKDSRIKVFEVWIERNKDLYKRPYFAITNIWELEGSNRLELSTPEPELRSALIRNFIGPLVMTFGTPILLILLAVILFCTVKSFQNIRLKRRDATCKDE